MLMVQNLEGRTPGSWDSDRGRRRECWKKERVLGLVLEMWTEPETEIKLCPTDTAERSKLPCKT